MNKSLGFRIVAIVVLVVLIAFGSLGIFLSKTIRENAVDSQEKLLIRAAEKIVNQVGSEIENTGNKDQLNQDIQNLAEVTGFRITVILKDGTVVLDSEEDAASMENHLSRPEITQALSGASFVETRYSRTLQKQLMYAAVPVIKNNQIIGVVRTAYPLDNINADMTLARNAMVNAVIIAALLIIFITIFSTTLLIRPLVNLTNQVEEYEAGKIPDFKSSNRKDEIGQLEKAFHRMTEQINNRFNDLGAERSRLTAILNHMNDGIIIVNQNGMVDRINKAAEVIFSISSTEAINKSIVEVLRQVQLVELWKACVSTGKQQVTTVDTSPDHLFLQGIATPISWGDQNNVMLIFQDLTRIHQLKSIRKDFVSNVSHELRTPLSSLKALTETLQETIIDQPEASQKFLNRMDQELDNLTQMVNELLELSKLESGKVPLDRQRISPSILLQAVEDRMRLQVERNHIDFVVKYPVSSPDVSADSNRIEQVLTNLVHNAIKFTQPGGRITIHTQEEENQVVFVINDTGIGIAPEMIARIFERFYKADHSRASTGAGLGFQSPGMSSKPMGEKYGLKVSWV